MNVARYPGAITAVIITGVFGNQQVLAHNPFTGSLQERFAGTATALILLTVWLLYIRGSQRIVPAINKAITFHLVFAISVMTLLSPLDDMAKTSTSAHMLQHMMMIVVIAPLWVLSQPLPQISAGSSGVGAVVWRPMLRLAQRPMTAACVHGALIWFWHMPVFYMAAVANPWWHSLEHLSFLLSAGVFWWAVLRGNRAGLPAAILALLFTLMHTGFLGAFLSFAALPVYGEARNLQDQQLAGLIMWVGGGIPYLFGLAWMLRRWFNTPSAT